MRNVTLKAVVGVAAATLAMTAMAQEKEYFGEGGAIPDNDPEGFTSEIFIEESGEIASFLSVGLFDFNHSWAGDLQIYLTHKDTGTMVTLLDRPGVPESGYGDSADFAGDYRWVDGGYVYDSDDFDATVPTDQDYGPVAGELADFNGEDKRGTWSLLIVDNAGGDTGGVGSWNMIIQNVPTPGALALLGLAGLTGTRRRRG